MRCLLCSVLMIAVALVGCRSEPGAGAGSVVRVSEGGGRAVLVRDGEPFFVRGAGGKTRLGTLAAAGGNSIRTWGARDAGEVLDRADEQGIAVTLGIWIGHPRHGFDYSDRAAVEAQRDRVRRIVREHKDHPALLMWAVGNEVELVSDPDLVFPEINRLARIVKGIDPDHPTMAVLAGTGEGKVEAFVRLCPDIDVLGINAYREAPEVAGMLLEQGYDGPFMLTEFGATGHWQVEKTPWGAAVEPTSTEKGITYEDAYRRGVLGHPDRCLGSYVFLWGQKQEVTPTWYGMFLPTGESTPTLDAMQRVWTGEEPGAFAPAIGLIVSPVAMQIVDAGATLTAEAEASDPDGDPLMYEWVIAAESTAAHVGGDPEDVPPVFPELILEQGPRARFVTPSESGAYRLFVTVRDGTGRAATANTPFFVR